MRKGNYSRNIGEKMKKVRFCVRRRSFVLIMGIGLMMGFAAFSYLGLSTQNMDLLMEIEQLEDNVEIGYRLFLISYSVVFIS